MEENNSTLYTEDVTLAMTERTDEVLHMILDLKLDKEVDLYRMQSLILSMYKDEIELIHMLNDLQRELDKKKRKTIEIPNFMVKKEAQV